MLKITFFLVSVGLSCILNIGYAQSIKCQDEILVTKQELENGKNYLCQNGTLTWKTILRPQFLQWNNIPICYVSADDGDNTLTISADSEYVQVNNTSNWSDSYSLKKLGVIDIDLITIQGVVNSNNDDEVIEVLKLHFEGTSDYLCVGGCKFECKK